jgi:amino acid adenylation domain-containing protein
VSGDGAVPGTVVDLIDRAIRSMPNRVAILSRSGQVTYGELGAKVGRVAARLRALGVRPGHTVGVLAEPSADGIIALISVIATGAAYLPLCPSLPRQRRETILGDSGTGLLLSGPDHSSPGLTVLSIVEAAGTIAASPRPPAAPVAVDPDSPAAVIYTSGSTGTPKGVVVPHRALVNRIIWGQQVYPLGPHDRVLQHSRYIYDFSAWEVFAPLAFGATIVTGGFKNYPDFTELAEIISEFQVTTVHFVPSVLSGFVGRDSFRRCGSLTTIFCGGEALANGLAQRLRAQSAATLYNQYGPTEAGIDCAFHRYDHQEMAGLGPDAGVPIGRPIDHTRLYVLDPDLRPVPAGRDGELFVAGAGLAHGYLSRPGLTAERFLPDPFGPPGERMYHTGDIVVASEDGTLTFRRRADLQVNVRGVRVELEEIESALSAYPDVLRSVAALIDGERPGLAAVVVPAPGSVVDEPKVREFIQRRLPSSFVPDQVFVTAELPLLPNGKADRAAVRDLIRAMRQAGHAEPPEPDAPDGDLRALVSAIWRESLEVSDADPDDSFFESGGHSLLAVEIVTTINEQFGVDVSLAEFFEIPTLGNLVALIETARKE